MSTDSSSDRDPVERLAEEFLERRRRGEPATIDEYAERYPSWAEQIREVFPALEMMERLKPASGDHTGSFEGGDGHGDGHPERLGDYRILREIGRGGMGVVYEAVQESLGRHVALKVLPMHGRIDPVQMERFRLEARSAAKLHHTHIVPVHGVGEHGGVHYYAMQYIQGCGLDAVLDDLRRLRPAAGAAPVSTFAPTVREAKLSRAAAESLLAGGSMSTRTDDGTVPPAPVDAGSGSGTSLKGHAEPGYYRAVARIGVQVAEALAHAHGQGVLHRDIKPSNLLLDADGEAWVTDFGLAKVEGSDGPTRTGDFVGTLRYMAPERFEGWSDPRSDVYGLGVTLYELLTLHPAYEGSTRARLIERVMHASPSSPRKLDPRIPRDLETVVLKAIAKEAGERYATAKALSEDLQNYLSGKPIKARRVGVAERTWRWCRRNPSAAGLVGVSVLAMLTLVGLGVALAYQSRLQAEKTRVVRAHAAIESAYSDVERERRVAQAALTSERDLLYQNRILFADRELQENNPFQAETLLNECPKDPRNWEWNYLKRQCHTELLSIQAHSNLAGSVVFSPDGRLIASGGLDKLVRIWDAQTGHLIREIHGHDVNYYPSVDFSPDGTKIVSFSGARGKPAKLLIHEVATGELLTETRLLAGGHGSSVVYHPDGRTVLACSGESESKGGISVLDATTGAERLTIVMGREAVYQARFCSEGREIVAVVGYNNALDADPKPNQIRIWDATSGELRRTYGSPTTRAFHAVVSPDGRLVVCCNRNGTVQIWDAKERHERAAYRGHRALVNVNRLAFSPDGRRIASTSDDGSCQVWDPQTGQEIITLKGHQGPFQGVAFSPDGRRLVTSGEDGVVKVWDVTRTQDALTLAAHSNLILSLDFSPDGRRLVTAGADRALKVWDTRTGELLKTWLGHTDPVNWVTFSPDGSRVASAAGDWQRTDGPGEIRVWDAATGETVFARPAHTGVAWCVAFSPDGRRLVSGGGEYRTPGAEVIVWDALSGDKVRMFTRLAGGVPQVTFSPDGRRLAAAVLYDIRVWDAETGADLNTLKGHKDRVARLKFGSDGSWLASGSNDRTVRIWDTATGRELRALTGHRFWILGLTVSPDGRRVVSASADQTVKIWDATTGQEMATLRGHHDKVGGLAISNDGQRIASGDLSGVVKIWDGSPIGGERK